MQISQILQTILLTSLLIPIIIILIYSFILLYYYRLKFNEYKIIDNKNYELPNITIIIPTHNEEKIISKRIENIFETTYPNKKIRIIFLDDSTDSTSNIIKNYVDMHDNIHLIKFNKRIGYSAAVQEGILLSDTDIIVLNEAGSFPRPNALLGLVNHFENPKIGCVTAKSEIINQNERVGKIESLYLRIINFIRESESNMDSTFYIKGEATAYRRALVSNVKAMLNTGSIDTSMAFLVRKKGYKCIYDPNVVFDEYAPSDDKGYIKQKTTRAANWVRHLIIYRDMIFNSKYGKFGLLTLPFNFLILIIFPFLSLITFTIIPIGLLFSFNFFIRIIIILFITSMIIFLLSSNFLILLVELEFSLLKALYEIFFIRKGHEKIERIESTRRAL